MAVKEGIGWGTTIQLYDAVDAGGNQVLSANVTGIDGYGVEIERIDTTHLGSSEATRTSIPGLKTVKPFTVTGFFDTTEDVVSNRWEIPTRNKVLSAKITFPIMPGESVATVVVHNGGIEDWAVSVPHDGVMTMSFVFHPSGPEAVTVGS